MESLITLAAMPSTDMAVYMKERRTRRRDTLIELAGGCCVRCGTPGEQFDHRDPATKLFVLSGCYLDRSWDKVLAEFEKCDLLCRPCHLKKTVENGETGGGHNRIDDHGTEAMYMKGCKGDACRRARHDARVARGELKGNRGFRVRNPVECSK